VPFACLIARSPKKAPKKQQKPLRNPILHEIRGFTYTHIQKAVFSVIKNPFFRIFFFPFGGFFIAWAAFFAAFLAERDND
jgi:hypothetical protein